MGPGHSVLMTASTILGDVSLEDPPSSTVDPFRLFAPLARPQIPPLQSLPNELLSNIFLIATHRDKKLYEAISKPTLLSHVCSRWRQLALSTGGLWTTIVITFPPSSKKLSRAIAWLARSKTYPLDVLLDFRDPAWDWEEASHVFRWQDMEAILRLFLVHATRWRSLELLTDTWAPIFTFLWYTRRVEAVPQLQKLSLSRCNAYFASKGQAFQPTALREPISLFGGLAMDQLKEVTLAGVHLDWTRSALRNLTILEFKYHASDVMPSLDQFTDILSECPDLRRLSIIGWGPQLDSVPMEDSTPSETRSGLRRSIQMKHLTCLIFGYIDAEYAIKLLSLFSFPSLEELALEEVFAAFSSIELEDATSILEWLTAAHQSKCLIKTSHSPNCCPCAAFPLGRIQSLQLHSIHSNQPTLSHFFSKFQSLRCLSISNTPDNVLHALAPSETLLDRPYQPLLPNLRELKCEDVGAEVLADVISARSGMDSVTPLEEISWDFTNPRFHISPAEYAKLTKAGVKILSDIPGPLQS